MNSISELRLLTTGPVGLADPGRLAATAAAPASAAQTAEPAVRTAEMASPAPEAGSNPESRGTQIHRRFARFETLDYADGIPDRDFEFGDLLDVINPLQHIPIIGSLYRNLTGDEISGPAKIMGGLLYGGPVGLVAALATTIAEQEVGRDLGEAALAAVFGDGEAGDLQLAEQAADAPDALARVPAQIPALPAAASAVIPAVTPAASAGPRPTLDRIDPDPVTITSVEQIHAVDRIAVGDLNQPRSALGGQDALYAFVRDIKGTRPAPPLGGTGDVAAIEVVPLPPLAPRAPRVPLEAQRPPNPQLAENPKTGAIEPGPLGWTIQRNAAPAPAPPAGAAAADPLAEVAEISGPAFSERMLRALDKYQAMSTLPPRDEDQAPRVDTRL